MDGCRHHQHGIVHLVRRPDNIARNMVARMWIQRIREPVRTLVSDRIGIHGTPQKIDI